MHDLDRTQTMYESEYQEMEFENNGQFEGEGSYLGETYESAFNEMEEMELAAELLEIGNEYELDQFLGDLLNKAKKAAGGFLNSVVGKQVGGLLKSAAKMALPAVGNLIAPGVGGAVASGIGNVLGLELEGLSPQDQEFEEARQFVRFAGEVAKTAAQAPPNAQPQQVAQDAVIQAAQKYAPGLIRQTTMANSQPQTCNRPRRHHHRSGRWVRHHDRIILLGV